MRSGISGEGLFTAHWVEVLKLGGSPVSGHVGLRFKGLGFRV